MSSAAGSITIDRPVRLDRSFLRVWIALGWGAGALYPALIDLGFTLARAAGPGAALGILVPLSVPVLGSWLIRRTALQSEPEYLRLRIVGLLLITVPAKFVVLRVLSTHIGQIAGSPISWPLFWSCALWGAASFVRWRGARLGSAATRLIRQGHRYCSLPILAFGIAHLLNNATAVAGLDLYAALATTLRSVYRHAFVEPLLLIALAGQVVSGLLLAWNGVQRRAAIPYLAQTASGLYLVFFISAHTIAVMVNLRAVLDRGPDFTVASAGHAGLLGSVGAMSLAPYYLLAMIAFFTHFVEPFRRILRDTAKERTIEFVQRLTILGAAVIVVLILTALISPAR